MKWEPINVKDKAKLSAELANGDVMRFANVMQREVPPAEVSGRETCYDRAW